MSHTTPAGSRLQLQDQQSLGPESIKLEAIGDGTTQWTISCRLMRWYGETYVGLGG